MRTIVHISDLHFGRTNPAVLPALRNAIVSAAPHLVVVSGDLTQRARSAEFAEARAFLNKLPGPQLVVPGNHDIPLYNIFRRWRSPLRNFQRYISEDLQPFYADGEIAVSGMNTARSLTFKDGRINEGQIARGCAQLSEVSDTVLRIVATHHPFAVADAGTADVVGRAGMAMEKFMQCRVDVVLSGHMHLSHTVLSSERYRSGAHSALLIQAGTATSERQRGEANSFNILKVDGPRLCVERLTWEAGEFRVRRAEAFVRTTGGWKGANPN